MSNPVFFSPPLAADTSSSSPPSSIPTSIIIVVIVIASAVIVTVSLYLLLKFISRRSFSSSFSDDVIVHSNPTSNRHVAPTPLLDSLPFFIFSSVSGNLTGGDCAVCLSKFEPRDKLRLLPLCCHAFHCECIDTWISTNQTCPLCRSTVFPTEADIIEKFGERDSFRVHIGSVSRRHGNVNDENEAASAAASVVQIERSYSIGDSFEYVMDGEGYEISVGSVRRGESSRFSDKEEEVLAGEVGNVSGRSWLREYVDRLASTSSRALSFRGSGRFFSRRRDDLAEDLDVNRAGEEISEVFRWLSGV